MAVAFVTFELLRPGKTIYNTVVSFVVGALVIAYLRRDLILLMLTGTLRFTALYLERLTKPLVCATIRIQTGSIRSF